MHNIHIYFQDQISDFLLAQKTVLQHFLMYGFNMM